MTSGAEYLRAADIVRLTGMSIRTVRRWIADEIIPSIKLGGARLVAKADLERLLSAPADSTEETDDGTEEHDGESI
jgi:excisionase family DNA binding protein